MYISASGALNAMYRQDLAANNLANSGTIGFKPVHSEIRQRDPARLEDNLLIPSDRLIERLGAGVLAEPTQIRLTQGALLTTANALDLAIEGEGFLLVRASASQSGDRLRLSRDGRLSLDSNGRLVNQAGLAVLDDANRPITLDPALATVIHEDGSVSQGGGEVARLAFVTVRDPEGLEPEGESLFRASASNLRSASDAGGRIVQGAIEQSSVDEIDALMDMQSASRAAQSNIEMISRYDRLMEAAISRFARVA